MRKRISSLTLRLVLTAFAWVALTLIVTALLLIVLFRGYIERRFDATLYDHMQELVAASEPVRSGDLQLTWIPADPRFNRPHSGWYWEIRKGERRVARSDSLWGSRLDVAGPLGNGERQEVQFAGPEGMSLRALMQDITFPDEAQPFVYVVAGPVSDIEHDVRAFTSQVTLTMAVLGAGLLLTVVIQVRFGLRPLRAMRRALGDIRAGRSERLAESYPVEVQPVINELNALLDHNAAMLERARTQAGNLAHALKNPLTVIGNEARSIEGGHGRVISDQLRAMSKSLNHYLSHARIAGHAGLIGARVDAGATAEDLRFTLLRLYQSRGIGISVSGLDKCWFRGEAQDLEEMLGNLMDNACKWARNRVVVHGEQSAGRLYIDIEDDGPGIPEQRMKDVLRRGHRLDETTPGSGLGLDIVQDIAHLYRGSLSLRQSVHGGLCARLDLPAAA
jgi:signal transduction histidine kinase